MRKREVILVSLVALVSAACSGAGSSAPARQLSSPATTSAQRVSPTAGSSQSAFPATSSAQSVPPATSSGQDGSPTDQADSQPPPEQSFSPPPEEPTGRASVSVTPSSHAGSGLPATITVGGPTLYDDYPNIGDYNLIVPGDTHCGYVKNSGGETGRTPPVGSGPGLSPTVPVTITSMAMVNQTPAGSTAFSVTADPGCPAAVTADVSLPSDTRRLDGCVGVTLPPWPGTAPTVCTFLISEDGEVGTNYTAELQVSYSALCAEPTGVPCGDPAVVALHPSGSHVVTVRWSAIETDWQACLATGTDEGWAFGQCPALRPSASPTAPPSPEPSAPLPSS